MSNNKKDSLSQDKKLHRTKIAATISIIISLILLIGFLSFQIFWNIFRFQFVKDGCAIVVDNQLAVGVEKIIRGEEANRILQERNPDYSDIEEGNEIALVKIKVKNINIWNAAPRYMEFDLYTAEYEWARDLLHKAYKPYEGEYKVLDTSKVFKPGETRDGIFYFEVAKEKNLVKIKVQSFHFTTSRKEIALSKRLLDQSGIFILLATIIYLLGWLVMYTLLRKRYTKRANSSLGMLNNNVINIIPLMYFAYIVSREWIQGSFYLWLIICICFVAIFVFYFFDFRRYFFVFYWLKKEDLPFIVNEFKKSVGWDASEIKEQDDLRTVFDNRDYDTVEICNEQTHETFSFTTRTVKAKKLISGRKKAKAIIHELFNQTEMNWLEYYQQLLHISTVFSILLLLYEITFFIL